MPRHEVTKGFRPRNHEGTKETPPRKHESTKNVLSRKHESTKRVLHKSGFVFSCFRGPFCFRIFVVCLLVTAGASRAVAADRWALIVTGASGGPQYAEKYDLWRTSFVATLQDTFGYPADHIVVLAEEETGGARIATREQVRAAFQDLAERVTKDDVLLVLLIGHGTAGDEDAKFNLVGPDLTAAEWAGLVKPVAGRVVFVNATSGSFDFLERIAGRGRVVVTATDSAAQQFETVFPEFFLQAFATDAADLDKNGRISVWEAFRFASAGVKDWFEEQGRLATERPLLDDNGDGVGREAEDPGPDGTLAGVTYLQPDTPVVTTDAALAELLRRRGELESKIDVLRAGKANMPPDRYETDLEALLLELARIDRQIRSKS